MSNQSKREAMVTIESSEPVGRKPGLKRVLTYGLSICFTMAIFVYCSALLSWVIT